MGGSCLYIESTALGALRERSKAGGEGAGKGAGEERGSGARLRTTGQLGEVMNESAQVVSRPFGSEGMIAPVAAVVPSMGELLLVLSSKLVVP